MIEQLKATMSQREKQLLDQADQLKEKDGAINELTREKTHVQEMFEVSEKQNSELRQDKTDLREQVSEIRDINTEKSAQIKELHEVINTKTSEYNTIKEQLDSLIGVELSQLNENDHGSQLLGSEASSYVNIDTPSASDI
ncbi:MAG: hypothetical protein AB8B66_06240 [Rickettsiaceae bacterium]